MSGVWAGAPLGNGSLGGPMWIGHDTLLVLDAAIAIAAIV